MSHAPMTASVMVVHVAMVQRFIMFSSCYSVAHLRVALGLFMSGEGLEIFPFSPSLLTPRQDHHVDVAILGKVKSGFREKKHLFELHLVSIVI